MIRAIFLLLTIISLETRAQCSADLTFGNDYTEFTGPTVSGMRQGTTFDNAINKYYLSMYGVHDKYFSHTITNVLCANYTDCQSINDVDIMQAGNNLSSFFIDKSKYNRSFWISDDASQSPISLKYTSGATNDTDAVFINQTFLMTRGATSLQGNNQIGLQIATEVPKPYLRSDNTANSVDINSKRGGIYFRIRDAKNYIDTWSPWMRLDKKEIESRFLKTRGSIYTTINDNIISSIGAPLQLLESVKINNQKIDLLNDTRTIKALTETLAFMPNAYVNYSNKELRNMESIIIGSPISQFIGGLVDDEISGVNLKFRADNRNIHMSGGTLQVLSDNNLVKLGVPNNTIYMNKSRFTTNRGDLIFNAADKDFDIGGTLEMKNLEVQSELLVDRMSSENGTITFLLPNGANFNFNGKEITEASTVMVGSLIISGANALITTEASALNFLGTADFTGKSNTYASTMTVGDLIIDEDTIKTLQGNLNLQATSGYNFNGFPLLIKATNNDSGFIISTAGNKRTKIVKTGFQFTGAIVEDALKLISPSSYNFNNHIVTIDPSSNFTTYMGQLVLIDNALYSPAGDVRLSSNSGLKVQNTDGSPALVNGILLGSGLTSVKGLRDFIAIFPISDFAPANGDLNMNNRKITNLANPTADNDLANLGYMKQKSSSSIKHRFQCSADDSDTSTAYKNAKFGGFQCQLLDPNIVVNVDTTLNAAVINAPAGRYYISYSTAQSCAPTSGAVSLKSFNGFRLGDKFTVGSREWLYTDIFLTNESDEGDETDRNGMSTFIDRQTFIIDKSQDVMKISRAITDPTVAGKCSVNSGSGFDRAGLSITGFCFANCQ